MSGESEKMNVSEHTTPDSETNRRISQVRVGWPCKTGHGDGEEIVAEAWK